MPTLSVPSIKWGKRKVRSQMMEIFTEDGRIVDTEVPVLQGCAVDESTGKGFLVDANNQYQAEDTHWYQICHDRTAIPLQKINPPKTKEDYLKTIRKIWDEAQKTEKFHQHEVAAHNTLVDKIMWIIAIPCVTALLLGILQWIKK